MTDYLADSPPVTRQWCPGCEPLIDPVVELVDERRCGLHELDRTGSEDVLVRDAGFPSGTAEAGGEPNRAWCDLLHRGQAPAAAPQPRIIVPDVGGWE